MIDIAQTRKEIHRLEDSIQRTRNELSRLEKQRRKLLEKLTKIVVYHNIDQEVIDERNQHRE